MIRSFQTSEQSVLSFTAELAGVAALRCSSYPSVTAFQQHGSTSGYDLNFFKSCLPRKEVIQPHLPIRLPCYDFTPVIDLAFGSSPLAVRILTSGTPNSHGVTGGVYKARERIHRGILIRDY